MSQGLSAVRSWMGSKGWHPFPFQEDCWEAVLAGQSGLLNAPTGSGKTYSLWLPCLASYINAHGADWQRPRKNGLRVLWITPLRALTKDIARAMQEACDGMGLPWQIAMRTGDTSASDKAKIQKQQPECLLTTPESLHLMLAQKGYPQFFQHLDCIVVDEWHELLGSKRGVQVELALSRLRALRPELKVWGISATIGNLDEAAKVLVPQGDYRLIKANVSKRIEAQTILPAFGQGLPWVGHIGTSLVSQVLPIVEKSATTLLFTNTRAQTEIWYQRLLEEAPDLLAGAMAMHHGSLDREVRDWVEESLHKGILKLVVCTSSLDLGVDFRPVETVIQVGSPKGVSRFLQRAGRSGHRPNAPSHIYFLPTHALEVAEGAALREAADSKEQPIEARRPLRNAYDVLAQYLVTLAVSEGFYGQATFEEVSHTYAYQSLSREEWQWCLDFVTTGGQGLHAYNEYRRVEAQGNDFYKVIARKTALRHRLSIGTIVSEPLVKVKLDKGGYVGTVEEYFISRLNPGDVFWFAGRNLEFVRLKDLVAQVRLSNKKAGQTPRWLGGRLPLSSELSGLLRKHLENYRALETPEMQAIAPLLQLQERWSCIPNRKQLLVETFQSEEGHHALFYPFQGRMVHELMAALVAYRIAQMQPITFSMAMNDYGFELLSDQPIPIAQALDGALFGISDLDFDLEHCMNQTELAKRKFREIAQIAGLLFQGYPGKPAKSSHLHASSSLIYKVFEDYDPDSLLLRQALAEVMAVQLEEPRLRRALEEIARQEVVWKRPPKPTPFAVPIMTDRMREMLSSESLADRLAKMQLSFEETP